ncbi:ACT domain-containing protein [Sulfitobacter mediterraneus]|uniref:ACT domain-containing protein n=1 Tax=Sulfitobacter mediterraneus TaxID=83219 RepID=UPI001932CCBB|nr:ACT domain-containing protein [Sulfitobacter mediterraneus]MBM1631427.1 ACT domain-containing protein [Sulfitobacter mediterraneus]MBM1639242.1 ACT domain-containing protein [Sulfitobacter mediterraneus]MBM1643291.1 ACT domain-containing protein [Sulfitobacter mediterraneus]MBM1647337.1 ACT domain-containing protein [Sulfitobacter mediterraneus]MBM1651382.1 ACT domain-containing protein [Sulfitobacter mediterraneus]
MPKIAHTAADMISGMSPELRPGIFVFATVDDQLAAGLIGQAISVFREDEGLSLLLPVSVAKAAGLPVDHPMRCITLNVYSSLEGVGLTAAVATALAANGIACNMVAAFHHDHAFVPEALGETAMQVLKALQSSG